MNVEKFLAVYRAMFDDESRLEGVQHLIERAPSDPKALETLLYILNEESSSSVRLAIVQFLRSARPLAALHALTKEMFDPDPRIRSQAALGVADYDDARVL